MLMLMLILVLVRIFAQLPLLPLPCVVGGLVEDLVALGALLLLWPPLNGGGGHGHW